MNEIKQRMEIYVKKLYLNNTSKGFRNKLWTLMYNDRYLFNEFVVKPFLEVHPQFGKREELVMMNIFLTFRDDAMLFRSYDECVQKYNEIYHTDKDVGYFKNQYEKYFDFFAVVLGVDISKEIFEKYNVPCSPIKALDYWKQNGDFDTIRKYAYREDMKAINNDEARLITLLYNLDPEHVCNCSCVKAAVHMPYYSASELRDMKKRASIKACFAEYGIPDYLRL